MKSNYYIEPVVIYKRRHRRTGATMKVRSGSTRWHILNYVVNEPGSWTLPEIVKDMGGNANTYANAKKILLSSGCIIGGDKRSGSKSFTLHPTAAGIKAFSMTVNFGSLT
jgi:hypothetical protein